MHLITGNEDAGYSGDWLWEWVRACKGTQPSLRELSVADKRPYGGTEGKAAQSI